MNDEIRLLTEKAEEKIKVIEKIKNEFEKVIVGQEKLFKRMMSAILSGGHILLEGVPGLAKTLAIRTMAQILNLEFKRIQFTPDMLPADIRGTLIYRQSDGNFEVKKGPIFANFILADEINRAPSKVQSALLESMQEKTVTIGDTTYPLPEPFFVMATQNPIEQEGTYPLPEAQTDRFYMKILIDYPSPKEEKRIIHRMSGLTYPLPRQVATKEDILELQRFVEEIYIDEKIYDYIVNLVYATRTYEKGLVRYGASPRASINFVKAAKVEAFFDGRGYVIPEDVKSVAYDILRHRIILSFEAEAEEITPEKVIEDILNKVEIP
ncbi:MAG: MoxR family ATPase [Brevinematales bacterium]|nr:MoxR family ATPase [Brevinematales bacterium]